MGADMCMAYVIRPKNEDPEELKERLLAKVDELLIADMEGLAEFFEEMYGEFPEESTLDELKELLYGVINDGMDIVMHQPRDTTFLYVEGKIIIMSGGMSWGDNPTESFGPLSKVSSLIYCLGIDEPEKILTSNGSELVEVQNQHDLEIQAEAEASGQAEAEAQAAEDMRDQEEAEAEQFDGPPPEERQ